MLEKIKNYYTEYKMYINILIGLVAVYVVYRLAKRK
ncbi:hypothetical protein MCETHM1_01657 [Flavobacteriaceae bacterium]